MSMYYGAFVGLGYLVTEEERMRLLEPLVGTEEYDEVMLDFYMYDEDKWFFGEQLYEFHQADAKSIESIAALTHFEDPNYFGCKYGALLQSFGLSVEEINTHWAKPNVYFVFWEDCF